MATKVFMEALSPTMEEGRLVKWLKNEGDAVKSGETIAEVETDKAIMELVARGDGVLRKRLLEEGATSPVATLIAIIAAPDEPIDALLAGSGGGGGAQTSGSGAGAATEASTPATGAAGSATSTTAAGDRPPSSEGATATGRDGSGAAPPQAAPSPVGPPLPAVESTRAGAAPSDQSAAARITPAAIGAGPTPVSSDSQRARARSSPLARRLASERGLELGALHGSGPGGRIIKRDVEAAVAVPPRATAAPGLPPSATRLPAPVSDADYRDVALSQMRKTIARRLVESIGPIPTFYLTADLDLERVAEMRGAMAAMGDEFKVSFNDIVLKAVATALSQHTECNAHWLGDHIRYWSRVHVGMAVAIDDGLITPVIFDADLKSLRQIAAESRDLASRARERRLKPEDYTGSTFSVSNLGMFGIEHFTAIINPPEAGILAIGAIEGRPVVVDGAVTVRRRMRVTMSCDHRVIDGATGARFLQTLRRLIENPLMLVY
jgi:pyruvate dehydrogenase E2 component (dihydrolipoamide acetyltransferase)